MVKTDCGADQRDGCHVLQSKRAFPGFFRNNEILHHYHLRSKRSHSMVGHQCLMSLHIEMCFLFNFYNHVYTLTF
jgi:hypothetical protein